MLGESPTTDLSGPILVLGAPGSGASAITGALHRGTGLPVGDVAAPTSERPLGTWQDLAVTEAHRELLSAVNTDFTCPPHRISLDVIDLDPLRAAAERLEPGTIVHAPATAFLLDAWRAIGCRPAALIGVIRTPDDAVASLTQSSSLLELEAEALIDAYLDRLRAIAERTDLHLVRFGADLEPTLAALGELADRLGTPWDASAASRQLDPDLITNSTNQPGASPTFEALTSEAGTSDGGLAPFDAMGSLDDPDPELERHHGPHAAGFRNAVTRALPPMPEDTITVEILAPGSTWPDPQPAGGGPRRRERLSGASDIAGRLLAEGLRPHRLVLFSMLDDLDHAVVEQTFSDLLPIVMPHGELILDVDGDPSPTLAALTTAGWRTDSSEPIRGGRTIIVARRPLRPSAEGDPLLTEVEILSATVESLHRQIERLDRSTGSEDSGSDSAALADAARRAERAERDLRRLRARRSVRVALAAARPLGPAFRAIRSMRNALGR